VSELKRALKGYLQSNARRDIRDNKVKREDKVEGIKINEERNM
jgi:hypothetical protein